MTKPLWLVNEEQHDAMDEAAAKAIRELFEGGEQKVHGHCEHVACASERICCYCIDRAVTALRKGSSL